ncbi:hypothetical protein VTO73DRAFT_7081 [Trametes versicolor]
MNSTDTAARRCLLISEIFRIILSFLSYTDGETLAVLARTCKIMHEAIVPTLWSYQDGLDALLRLLPSDSWSEVLDEHRNTSFRITKPDRIEWTRFDHYAGHVRDFVWPSDVKELSPSTLAVLSHRCADGRPLFPQIRSLILKGPTAAQGFSYANLFLAPTLSQLVLSVHFDRPDTMCQAFKHVGATCKNLMILQLRGVTAEDDLSSDPEGPTTQKLADDVNGALAELLRALPKLGIYSTERLFTSASCMEALATLPRLSLVHFDVLPEEMDTIAASAACRQRGGKWFNALADMWLSVDRLDESTAAFFDALRGERLRQLEIRSFIQPDSSMLKKHFELVARHPLTNLKVIFDDSPTGNRGPTTFDAREALQPLYAVSNLSHLEIRCPVLDVSARAVRDTANAWRGIQTLAFYSYGLPHPGVDKPSLTLEDLVPLAVNCLRLDELVIPLNAEKIPDEAVLKQLLPEPSQCALWEFTAVHAPIEDPGQVAGVLARLFPELRAVNYHYADEPLPFEPELGAFECKWEEVDELLQGQPVESDSDEENE